MKSVIIEDVARRDLTTRQVADELGIPVSTLQYWAAKGRITPAWRTPGGMARWDLEDLQRQLDIPGGRRHRPGRPAPAGHRRGHRHQQARRPGRARRHDGLPPLDVPGR
jgi:excisionase family DNA binding protein